LRPPEGTSLPGTKSFDVFCVNIRSTREDHGLMASRVDGVVNPNAILRYIEKKLHTVYPML